MSQNLVIVLMAVRSVTTADATVVAQQRNASVGRVDHRLFQDLYAVADVALDVKEVLRASAPLSAVQWHDLH